MAINLEYKDFSRISLPLKVSPILLYNLVLLLTLLLFVL